MSGFLVVRGSTYKIRNREPSKKPYLRVGDGYVALSLTSAKGLVLSIMGHPYMPYNETQTATSSSTYTEVQESIEQKTYTSWSGTQETFSQELVGTYEWNAEAKNLNLTSSQTYYNSTYAEFRFTDTNLISIADNARATVTQRPLYMFTEKLMRNGYTNEMRLYYHTNIVSSIVWAAIKSNYSTNVSKTWIGGNYNNNKVTISLFDGQKVEYEATSMFTSSTISGADYISTQRITTRYYKGTANQYGKPYVSTETIKSSGSNATCSESYTETENVTATVTATVTETYTITVEDE